MKKIITIPNILSVVRIGIIPFIAIEYFKGQYLLTAALLLLSGLTDVVDGFIARRFNMISEVGKVLDPIADKLTQVAVIVCLMVRHPVLLPLVVVVMVKELIMLIGAFAMINRASVTPYARWWGKMATAVLYAMMGYIVIDDFFGNIMPPWTITAFSAIGIICVIFALLGYGDAFRQLMQDIKNKKQTNLNDK